ncbi:hypothetical protein [Streptomyces cinnamoneus]|uniref:Lipoprotein n=1 Tax=Streptomyces cinnamoneus TaxID=53446 RepID=A0A918TLU0_STRCJ|nr:hypothetical protein [Streptomyces cinnamoneus]GHC51542.1 lipoprotein [Streptomyces cinnamoneus]
MGALRRIHKAVSRLRYAAGAAALAAAAVMTLTGCQPAAGLDAVTVAVTTQRQAGYALDREGVRVAWLNCTGTTEGGGKDSAGNTQPVTAIGVDCEGRTDSGKKIIVFGRVTGITGQACVHGLLTAKVDGRTVFSVSVLGDCSKTAGGPPPVPSHHPGQSGGPAPSASCTDKPPPGDQGHHQQGK